MSTTVAKNKIDFSLKKIRLVGYTKDVNQCQCCGKMDLRGTVIVRDEWNDDTFYFGIICAAKANKYDTLEAAKASQVKIASLKNELKKLDKDAAFYAFKKNRQITDQAEYTKAFEADKAAYIAERIEKVTYYAVNREQIEADRKAVKAEFEGSKEYSEFWDYIRELNDHSSPNFKPFYSEERKNDLKLKTLDAAMKAKEAEIKERHPFSKFTFMG